MGNTPNQGGTNGWDPTVLHIEEPNEETFSDQESFAPSAARAIAPQMKDEEAPIETIEASDSAHVLRPEDGKALTMVLESGAELKMSNRGQLMIVSEDAVSLPALLKAPSKLQEAETSDASIEVLFDAPESVLRIHSYEVYDDESETVLARVHANPRKTQQSATCTDLAPDTLYKLKVRAYAQGGIHSAFSNRLEVRTDEYLDLVEDDAEDKPIALAPGKPIPGAVGYAAKKYIARNKPIRVVKGSGKALTKSFLDAVRALNREGGGTIVFASSGIIDFEGRAYIDAKNIRIEGQTAPGKGIFFKGPTTFRGRDLLIRHVGFFCPTNSNRVNDAVEIKLPKDGKAGTIYMDHVAFWGANDGNLDIVGYHGGKVTLSHCIFSSPVKVQRSSKNHNFNSLLHGRNLEITIFQSLFQNSRDRNPLSRASKLEIVNCVYDARSQRFVYLQNGDDVTSMNIIRDNYFYDLQEFGSKPIHIGAKGWKNDSFVYASNNYRKIDGKPGKLYANAEGMISGKSNVRVTPMSGTLQDSELLEPQALISELRPMLGPNPGRRIGLMKHFVAQMGKPRQRVDMNNLNEYDGDLVRSNEFKKTHHRELNMPNKPHEVERNGFTRLENWLESFNQ